MKEYSLKGDLRNKEWKKSETFSQHWQMYKDYLIEEVKNSWLFCLTATLFSLTTFFIKTSKEHSCLFWMLWMNTYFLLGSKLSYNCLWAQEDFVNVSKVFLTEKFDKCSQWETGYLTHCQLSKKNKIFP